MQIEFTSDAQKDLLYWDKLNNKRVLSKITKLIKSIIETPFEGIGKPEPLKYDWSGCWSRRIDKENRLVYEVNETTIIIYSLKGHYE